MYSLAAHAYEHLVRYKRHQFNDMIDRLTGMTTTECLLPNAMDTELLVRHFLYRLHQTNSLIVAALRTITLHLPSLADTNWKAELPNLLERLHADQVRRCGRIVADITMVHMESMEDALTEVAASRAYVVAGLRKKRVHHCGRCALE